MHGLSQFFWWLSSCMIFLGDAVTYDESIVQELAAGV